MNDLLNKYKNLEKLSKHNSELAKKIIKNYLSITK